MKKVIAVLLMVVSNVSGQRLSEKTDYILSRLDSLAVIEFQKAWHLSHNGTDGFEGLVLVYKLSDGSVVTRSQGRSGEQKRFSFGWTSGIIGVIHTHPNGVDPRPAGDDSQLADKFKVPVFTLTSRGMYVYDPDTKKISLVRDGLSWLEAP